MVPRTALLERLLAAPAARLLSVAAPSGYGKSTLLGQWAERRSGRVAWVSLDRHDNDPVVLLSYIATALDRVEPIDPGIFRNLGRTRGRRPSQRRVTQGQLLVSDLPLGGRVPVWHAGRFA